MNKKQLEMVWRKYRKLGKQRKSQCLVTLNDARSVIVGINMAIQRRTNDLYVENVMKMYDYMGYCIPIELVKHDGFRRFEEYKPPFLFMRRVWWK